MARIFVSYHRQSQEIARALVGDLSALGHSVWFDQQLSGGQSWWERILASVRECDVFVFVLAEKSLQSTACNSEFGYAARLGKPILPVLVSDGVAVNLMPRELSLIQFVDYRRPDRQAAFSLARALATIPPAPPLPVPLPPPPEVPASYLGGLAQRVDSAPILTYEEQSAVLVDLRRGLRDPETIGDSRALLERLRQRRDLYAAVAAEIDELLRIGYAPVARPSADPAPIAVPAPPGQSVRDRLIGFGLGAVVGAIAGGFGELFDQVGNDAFPQPPIVAAVTVGLVGALTGTSGKLLRYALIGLAVGVPAAFAVEAEEFIQMGAMYTCPAGAFLAVVIGLVRERVTTR